MINATWPMPQGHQQKQDPVRIDNLKEDFPSFFQAVKEKFSNPSEHKFIKVDMQSGKLDAQVVAKLNEYLSEIIIKLEGEDIFSAKNSALIKEVNKKHFNAETITLSYESPFNQNSEIF
jgi:hypothetical protein